MNFLRAHQQEPNGTSSRRQSNSFKQIDLSNPYFRFKQFTIFQDKAAMKVTTDACLFGAWAGKLISENKVADAQMLDVGTGTGLLALMIAQKNPQLRIYAVDIDAEACIQAKENINAAGIQHRIDIIHGDVLKLATEQKYEFIVCNPPFYENELRSPNPSRNIAHHDQSLLLKELFAFIFSGLSASGHFFLLLPYKRSTEIEELFRENGLGIMRQLLVRATDRHPYTRVCYHGKLFPAGDIVNEEISIRNTTGEYTPAFIALLKDYYLYL
jgi:tRNA1Val (adenine37-N6)-methyltransferase